MVNSVFQGIILLVHPLLHSPFESVDGPVHGPLALLLVPDGQEVQRAPRQASEQREQGHAGADLKQE